jgi:hypothetical protein
MAAPQVMPDPQPGAMTTEAAQESADKPNAAAEAYESEVDAIGSPATGTETEMTFEMAPALLPRSK